MKGQYADSGMVQLRTQYANGPGSHRFQTEPGGTLSRGLYRERLRP